MQKRMKNKKEIIPQNYLEKIPVHKEGMKWSADDNGKISLHIENKGVFNRIFQLILKKPKVSFVHLDETGSFIWPLIDGEKNLIDIAEKVKEHFGEAANPLYERVAKYFQILSSYGFVEFK